MRQGGLCRRRPPHSCQALPARPFHLRALRFLSTIARPMPTCSAPNGRTSWTPILQHWPPFKKNLLLKKQQWPTFLSVYGALVLPLLATVQWEGFANGNLLSRPVRRCKHGRFVFTGLCCEIVTTLDREDFFPHPHHNGGIVL